MIVNKQACKSSNIGQANIEKTDTFSTSAEISLLILEIIPDHVCHVGLLYTVRVIRHNFQN